MNPILKQTIRRWSVHLIWLAVTGLAFGCGIKLGFRAYMATLGILNLDNQRGRDMDSLTTALRLVEKDQLDAYRSSADWRIRESIFLLALSKKYSACSETEQEALTEARRYLATHPYPKTTTTDDPFAADYESGLAWCKGETAPRPSLFF
ncbi:hypothetical protein [Xanthomonas sp. NCPPB 2632]|jgi:hypothetical protein|uniref:hypothetical protein n=1 Tax=Xanthomonas sp. NCPPB 2632 TaxID=3240912 RepID=UPI0035141F8A